MKRVIVLVSVLFFLNICFLDTSRKANADEPNFYMRVIDENTAIYKDKYCEDLLFYLPYTYYVKILSFNELSVFVEIFVNNSTPSIDGYVKKDLLFNDYTSPDKPYVDLTLTTVSIAVLYSDLSLSNEICYIFENRNLTFYGRAFDQNNNYYYFVSYNNKLGYVKESVIMPFVIENHPNELTFLPPEIPEEIPPEDNLKPENNVDSLFTLKVIIIVCLVFAVIIGFFLALRKKPSDSFNQNYFDENDYE